MIQFSSGTWETSSLLVWDIFLIRKTLVFFLLSLLGDSIFKAVKAESRQDVKAESSDEKEKFTFWWFNFQVESHSEGCEGRVGFIFDFYFRIFLFRRIFYKMGLNFRGVALFPSPSALNTLCGILYHEDFDRCARASALAGKFQPTRDEVLLCSPPRVPQRLWQGGKRASARSFAVKPSFILAEVTP